jgi:hypothetical protein
VEVFCPHAGRCRFRHTSREEAEDHVRDDRREMERLGRPAAGGTEVQGPTSTGDKALTGAAAEERRGVGAAVRERVLDQAG